MHILLRLATLERKIKMLDANVALVKADIDTLKTNVLSIAVEVSDLLVKQAAAIDAEDLAAIQAMHTDMVAANASLAVTLAKVPTTTATPEIHADAPVAPAA